MSSQTIIYKRIGDLPVKLDVYHPTLEGDHASPIPVVMNFHGGGLTIGNRRTCFPEWLKSRLVKAGIAFISADYRLLGPTTGHDVLEDIKDAFQFVAHKLNAQLNAFQIDPAAIAVCGSSAGGLCAFLAATQATPKPVAILGIYPMGGNLLHDDRLNPAFYLGVPPLDVSKIPEYLYPQSKQLPVIADDTFCAPYELTVPHQVIRGPLYFQLGEWLDYYTGDHKLSQRLRSEKSKNAIAEEHINLFPQFGKLSEWSPTFLMYAEADSAVRVDTGHHLHELLKEAGVDVTFRVAQGEEHIFDLSPGAEEVHGKLFDEAAAFLVKHLRK